jgi:hypothetical protein
MNGTLVAIIVGTALGSCGCEGAGGTTGSPVADMLRVEARCDVTVSGRGLAVPRADAPVYYSFYTLGPANSANLPIEGTQPDSRLVERLLGRALRDRGYRSETFGSSAAVSLMVAWGRLSPTPEEAAKLHPGEAGDRYYLMVAALDPGGVKQGKMIPLWWARANTGAQGRSLVDVLPTLIATAGPLFGTQSIQPESVEAARVPMPEPPIFVFGEGARSTAMVDNGANGYGIGSSFGNNSGGNFPAQSVPGSGHP